MNIGEYIRTPFGITKCSNKHQIIIEEDLYETKYGYLYYLEDYDDEVYNITDSNLNEYKHSPNIIDLIEAGDYVNGYLVKHVSDDGVYIDIPFVDSESIGCNVDLIRTEEIETIVTKEQFESMEYKVVE